MTQAQEQGRSVSMEAVQQKYGARIGAAAGEAVMLELALDHARAEVDRLERENASLREQLGASVSASATPDDARSSAPDPGSFAPGPTPDQPPASGV